MNGRSDFQNKKVFYQDDTIFREGEEGDAAYVIESGAIEIIKFLEGEEVVLATLGPGELFGEMAIIDPGPRMAGARAVTESVVIVVNRAHLESRLEKYDKFLSGLIRVLISNLRSVHKAYMHRPRSVDDHLDAASFHLDGLKQYLENMEDEGIDKEATEHLDDITNKVADLKKDFQNHKDRRSNVIDEKDLTSQGKPEKTTPRT